MNKIIHFSNFYGAIWSTACNVPWAAFSKITQHRNKVTCKRCKKTKRFKNTK